MNNNDEHLLCGHHQVALDLADVFGLKKELLTKMVFEIDAKQEATVTATYVVPIGQFNKFVNKLKTYQLVEVKNSEAAWIKNGE